MRISAIRTGAIFDCRHDLQNTEYGAQAYVKGHIPGCAVPASRPRPVRREDRPQRPPSACRVRTRSPSAWANAASAPTPRSSPTTTRAASSPPACGGCCAGSATTGWRCSMAACRPGGGRSRPLVTEVPSLRARRLRAKAAAGDAGRCRLRARTLQWHRDTDSRRPLRRALQRREGDARSRSAATSRARSIASTSTTSMIAGVLLQVRRRTARRIRRAAGRARSAPGVVQQCGSGVTACHNMLAMEIAGLPGSRLYAGSWSEWCADPARPVVTGGERRV